MTVFNELCKFYIDACLYWQFEQIAPIVRHTQPKLIMRIIAE